MTLIRFNILILSVIVTAHIFTASAQAATLYNNAQGQTMTAPTAAATQTPPPVANPAPLPSTATPPANPAAAPSSQAAQFGKQAGGVCPGKWDSPECLSTISSSNLVMLADYGTALQKKGLNDDAEQIKQHCAASTAAREKSFPAYAMKSAFIECANLIADTTAKTGVQPDLSEYQLMVGATMCLDKDARCTAISEQLKALAAK